jgi:hypothetical protein
MLPWPRKSPGERLDFSCDFAGELLEGETIASVVWRLDDSSGLPPDLTADSESLTGTTAMVWLEHGLPKRK